MIYMDKFSSLKTNRVSFMKMIFKSCQYVTSLIRLEAKFLIFGQSSLWINLTNEL